ncbi:MAG: GNAT family N-acetyltransferase [Methyloceanibacter sp.]|uniref:GNAT family N-acetyltransferase n=1 Tax=Methyloceanibacter sp. TaxID=1965321 RepID=UPI003D6D83A0
MGDVERYPWETGARAAEPKVVVRIAPCIADVPAAEWDACATGGALQAPATSPANPFVSHAFLKALEESGSATRATGWLPQHLLYEDGAGRLLACMPCYLKSHSQGEYVFDHGWAEAYMRAGGRYYPKLQASVPFTPVTGPRLLVRDCADRSERQTILLDAGVTLANELGVSSLHITFMTRAEWDLAGRRGFLKRTDQQFHWRNDGYACFDDFLGALTSRKRKTIRKERREALDGGVDIEWVTGRALTEAHWDAFFAFYMDTGSRKWGSPYLTRECFSLLGQSMADQLLLILAKRGGRYIAGALNLIGADTLYGRYWGATESHDFLHFEVCYYQAIAFAIAHGLATVEAGAQGAHKLARGYLPVETYSAHYIADPGLRRAVADYLRRERLAVAHEAALLGEESPYRRDRD